MYTRVQSKKNAATGLKIPENYSGNAFTDIPKYNDSITSADIRAEPTYFDLDKDDVQERASTAPPTQAYEPNDDADSAHDTSTRAPTEIIRAPSLFSSLFPSNNLKDHFPFGHGIGSEELLILGVMAVLFFSDESGGADGELIMLLAMLLFAG